MHRGLRITVTELSLLLKRQSFCVHMMYYGMDTESVRCDKDLFLYTTCPNLAQVFLPNWRKLLPDKIQG